MLQSPIRWLIIKKKEKNMNCRTLKYLKENMKVHPTQTGDFVVCIRRNKQIYRCKSGNKLAYSCLTERGAYSIRQAHEMFYEECLRKNHLK